PATTSRARSTPSTRVGRLRSSFVPSPTCPKPLRPQHRTPPPTTAQVCPPPADTELTPSSPAIGAEGLPCVVRWPSPSCPNALSPLHEIEPPAGRLHRCAWPPASAPVCALTNGVRWASKAPSASCSLSSAPQHHTRGASPPPASVAHANRPPLVIAAAGTGTSTSSGVPGWSGSVYGTPRQYTLPLAVTAQTDW